MFEGLNNLDGTMRKGAVGQRLTEAVRLQLNTAEITIQIIIIISIIRIISRTAGGGG